MLFVRLSSTSFLLLLYLFLFSTAQAQDRVFNYTYQSIVLGHGQRELEVWNTIRWGRSEFYRGFDHRLEFETGLALNLQTAFYLNVESASATVVSPGTPTPATSLETETELSFSNEWKLKLTDPVADPFGFALYGEYTIGSKEIELEPKLILDKVFGRAVVAFNASAEFAFEKEIEDGTEVTGRETSMEMNLGASYQIGEGFYLGIEALNRNGFHEGSLEYSALFAGPTLSYAADRFWVNVTVMPQLTALKGATYNGLVLNALERVETRLLFSYAL